MKILLLNYLKNMDYEHIYGPNIERDFYSPFYEEELENSLHNINRGFHILHCRKQQIS